MKQFFDFFPVLIFAIAYFVSKNMILATEALIGASIVQIAGYWLLTRKFERLHLGTFAVVAVMGGLTIALKDPTFIKWKPTIINWTLAVVFLGSQFIGRRNLLEKMVEGFLKQAPHLKLELPAEKWAPLNISWVIFFFLLGATNLYVAFNFEESVWVTFKFIGLTILNMVFVIAQFVYLSRYISEVAPDSNSESQG